MKNKLFGLAGFLAAILLLQPAFALAEDELKKFLIEAPQQMTGECLKLIDSLNQSFVGIGVQFIEANEININGKTPTVVYIVEVLPKSPAARAGVRVRDVVSYINGRPFPSGEEFRKEVIGDGKPERLISLVLLRRDGLYGWSEQVLPIATAFFGVKEKDKDKSENLKFNIIFRCAGLMTERKIFADELIVKMDDPQYALSNEDASKYNEMVIQFEAWLKQKEKEIEDLKAPY